MTDDSSFVPSSGEGSDSEQDTSLRRTNLKSRPSVSGTGHGKRDQDLLLEIEKRRQQFRVPANLKSQGFEPFRLTRPSRSTAISFGVKLVVYKDKEKTVLDETLTCYWCCLVCNNQPLRMRHDNTSAATSHLWRVHGIQSSKMKTTLRNRSIRQGKNMQAHKLYYEQTDRFFGLQTALYVIDCCLPFAAVTRTSFLGLFVGVKFPTLYPRKLKSYLLQIFYYLKQEIRKKFKAVKECCAGLPFLHLSVDLYTSKLLNVKFLGIRVTFTDVTDEQQRICSYNLAIRLFKPTSFQRDNSTFHSDLLLHWVNCVLSEYDLSNLDILTATTDNGSDIRRLIDKCVKIPREWCIAHLLNCCLVDGFGVNTHVSKSKNKGARAITTALTRIIEHFNKSSAATTKIQELQEEAFGKTKKLSNFAYQRWTSAYRVYKMFLDTFEVLQQYFNQTKTKIEWPPVLKKRLVHEFCSILKLLLECVVAAQDDEAVCLHAISKLMRVYLSLQPRQPLTMCVVDNASEGNEIRSYEELDRVTQTVIETLHTALNLRYFDRFHPVYCLNKDYQKKIYLGNKTPLELESEATKFSYIFELCTLLIPRFREGRGIERIVKIRVQNMTIAEIPPGWDRKNLVKVHTQNIINFCWNIVKDLCATHSEAFVLAQDLYGEKNQSTPRYSKKPSHEMKKGRYDDEDWLAGTPISRKKKRATRSILSDEGTSFAAKERVEQEISCYISNRYEDLDSVKSDTVLKFWQREASGTRFPILAKVASILLSARSSAAAIERDFCPASDIMSRKRGRLSPWVVEVSLLIKLNFPLLPDDLCDIQEISRATEQDLLTYLKKAHTERESEIIASVEDILAENCREDEEKWIGHDAEAEHVDEPILEERSSELAEDGDEEKIQGVRDRESMFKGKKGSKRKHMQQESCDGGTMSSETPVLRRQPRRTCKIRNTHGHKLDGKAGAAGDLRSKDLKRKCKKAQPNLRQRQNENAENKTSRMKTQKTHGKHLSSNQKETRDESKRTPIWKPIPQMKPAKRSTAKKRTYDANKKTQNVSRSPVSKPKPQSKAKKKPHVKKWSHKNPPPLPSDWSDWDPWLKEVWREQWRDPKERLEENIRLHKRAVKEAIERNRLRSARMTGSSSACNGSGPSPTKQGFRSLFPHKVPNLEASLPEDVLGVEVNCTKEQAAKQFRRLSLVLHPDKNKDPKAKDWFTKVNDAYLKLKHHKNW